MKIGRRDTMALQVVLAALLLSGCATTRDLGAGIAGLSTAPIEDSWGTALTRVVEEDYKACYARIEELLKKMPVKVYAKRKEMIALFETSVNTTPVGIYLTPIDDTHTQIAIASPSTTAKEWIAACVFSGKPRQAPESVEYL